MSERNLKYEIEADLTKIRFFAMGSPCEILLYRVSESTCKHIGQLISAEAWRIEAKYSRYKNDNIIHKINNSNGKPINVDTETAKLLDFAEHCYNISDGYFDVTSGVLRRLWQFNHGQTQIPQQTDIEQLKTKIGWNKVRWHKPELCLKTGMEIDFGGIGKEYAVDLCAIILNDTIETPFLINFGGDLYTNKPQSDKQAWSVGIENPDNTEDAKNSLQLQYGALATSGDVRRYIEVKGKRYGHILNPLTGWPIEHAPRSVTVHAKNCTDAGILSTLAMLHGAEAEAFLDAQDVQYWCYR